ncbi:MAG: Rieske 2Fe-2S domain-containing protein [Pelolinea sp.]|nr:Rieske 2Fe-2S domain-containing protein [Pelolinea sp.]
MIPNQWYAVLDSKQLIKSNPLGIRRFGENLLMWRAEDGQVTCLQD